MGCCGKSDVDDTLEVAADMEKLCKKEVAHKPFNWHPTIDNVKQIAYVRRLECKHEALQSSYLTLNTQLARLQFRIRQLLNAKPSNRAKLVEELERVVFKEISAEPGHSDKLPTLKSYNACMGNIKQKQTSLIDNLRERVGCLPLSDDPAYDHGVDLLKNVKTNKVPSKCEEPVSKKSSLISQKQSSTSIKISESNSRKPGGSDNLFANSSTMTTDIEREISIETSERSISFQELRNIYQQQANLN